MYYAYMNRFGLLAGGCTNSFLPSTGIVLRDPPGRCRPARCGNPNRTLLADWLGFVKSAALGRDRASPDQVRGITVLAPALLDL